MRERTPRRRRKVAAPPPDDFLPGDLFAEGYEAALRGLEEKMRDCPDLVRRRLNLKSGEEATLFYLDGLVDRDLLQRDLLGPLCSAPERVLADPSSLPLAQWQEEASIAGAVERLFYGFVLLVAEERPSALAFALKGWKERSLEEPQVERNIRGAHEGFTEDLGTNMALLRRRLRTPRLKFSQFKLGERAPFRVCLAYLEDLACPELLDRLKGRLARVDLDAVQFPSYLEQLTAEHPFSPFPQYETTERPDKAAAALLEGRVVVLLDGAPGSLLVPANFFQFFQAPDDYNMSWVVASTIRFFRILAVFLAILLPSFYVALLTFHYEAIPWSLLLPLVAARTKVPLPPVMEAFFMAFIIELIFEAAVRLPSYIGQVIGIVGGLVIGQAIVAAGIVSNVMVIIIAVTAVANFAVPAHEMSLAMRFIRFPIMVLSAFFGIVGLLVGGSFLLTHLLGLESLGQPYFSPLAPFRPENLKDAFVRGPLTAQGPRPRVTRPLDPYRGKGRR